jgi:methionyl-tRNA formyltransferase
MKIILFGEDLFTATVLESLLDHGHEIASVICPHYDCDIQFRSIEKAAKKKDILFMREKNVNSEKVRDHLLNTEPDIIVCVHLRKILSKNIFSIPGKGAINIHPSLLPKYRGLSPQHQALLHGDKETGVTIHFIDEGVDTGDIIIQQKIPLSAETYIYNLQMEMLLVYKHLIVDALKLIGTKGFRPFKQSAAVLPYYGALKAADREIDLKKTTFETYNLIRAVSKPNKGAYHGNLIIWSSVITDFVTGKALIKKYPHIGIYKDQDRIIIRLHDGFLISDDFEITATQ